MRMIWVKDISKSYGDKKVLDHFSMTVPEGKVTCIMGASGCGKTTLLRILMGLETQDAGTVEGLSKTRISAVFQEDRLCENLSAMANIRLVCPGRDKKEIEDQMARVGLGGCKNQPARELSGGMRRRVALLRALDASGDVLLLDEPFKGLDEETKARAIDFVDRSREGRTILCVTHDAEEARALKAEKIVRME